MMSLYVAVPTVTVPIQLVGTVRTGQANSEVLMTYMGVKQGGVLGEVTSGRADMLLPFQSVRTQTFPEVGRV